MTTKSDKRPQWAIVLDHLRGHGYITQGVASLYGITRLASRIDELKNAGNEITSEIRYDDFGRRYAYYTLTATAQAA